jgi:hypothetical protein
VVVVTEAELFWAPARTEEKTSAPNSSTPHPKRIRRNFAPWPVIQSVFIADPSGAIDVCTVLIGARYK